MFKKFVALALATMAALAVSAPAMAFDILSTVTAVATGSIWDLITPVAASLYALAHANAWIPQSVTSKLPFIAKLLNDVLSANYGAAKTTTQAKRNL